MSNPDYKSMTRRDLAMHINMTIENSPRTFPIIWKLRAILIPRNNELGITLTYSSSITSEQVWERFDLVMHPDISSQVM